MVLMTLWGMFKSEVSCFFIWDSTESYAGWVYKKEFSKYQLSHFGCQGALKENGDIIEGVSATPGVLRTLIRNGLSNRDSFTLTNKII